MKIRVVGLGITANSLEMIIPLSCSLSQCAKPSSEVLFQLVGSESVLLGLASEQYFGLDPVGTRIWVLLGEDSSLKAVFERLLSEYEVAPDRLETDLLTLVGRLSKAGLVLIE